MVKALQLANIAYGIGNDDSYYTYYTFTTQMRTQKRTYVYGGHITIIRRRRGDYRGIFAETKSR